MRQGCRPPVFTVGGGHVRSVTAAHGTLVGHLPSATVVVAHGEYGGNPPFPISTNCFSHRCCDASYRDTTFTMGPWPDCAWIYARPLQVAE
jgi:hypothetical protein